MPFTLAQRRTLLTFHVGASVGWFGALLVFGAHAFATIAATDQAIVRSAAWAMQVAAWYVILPLALVSLGSGVVQAVGGDWGIARHYWIAIKLVLTVVATAVLIAKLGPIDTLAAAPPVGHDPSRLKASLLVHAAGGLIVLALATALAIWKPAGLVGRGYPVPAWVKAFGIALVSVTVLILFLLLASGHGHQS